MICLAISCSCWWVGVMQGRSELHGIHAAGELGSSGKVPGMTESPGESAWRQVPVKGAEERSGEVREEGQVREFAFLHFVSVRFCPVPPAVLGSHLQGCA